MKKVAALLLAVMMCLSMTACNTIMLSESATPVQFDDTEVLVGSTKVSTLLNAGFEVKASIGGDALPADTPLEKKSNYSGLMVFKGDVSYAMINVMTSSKNTTLADGVVGSILATKDMDQISDHLFLAGISLPEMTTDAFKENVKYPEVSADGSSAYHSGSFPVNVEFDNGEVIRMNVMKKYSSEYVSKKIEQ